MQFQNFDRRNLKYLRIYLKQPSPNWLDFSLREIQVFMKKSDNQMGIDSYQSSTADSKSSNPFDMFKSVVKRNVQSLHKDQDSNMAGASFAAQFGEAPTNNMDQEEYAAMARYHWTQEVPSYIYSEDVRKLDLYYNII